eukprot:885977-Prymnesium_polylepis.1
MKEAKEEFDGIDSNKDGFVTREEILEMDEPPEAEEITEFFSTCDTNKDGKVSFDEIVAATQHSGNRPARMTRRWGMVHLPEGIFLGTEEAVATSAGAPTRPTLSTSPLKKIGSNSANPSPQSPLGNGCTLRPACHTHYAVRVL